MTNFHGDEAKRIQNGWLKKNWGFQPPPKAEQFPPKFHGLVLGLVGLIDWCEGHWCGSSCSCAFMIIKVDKADKKGQWLNWYN